MPGWRSQPQRAAKPPVLTGNDRTATQSGRTRRFRGCRGTGAASVAFGLAGAGVSPVAAGAVSAGVGSVFVPVTGEVEIRTYSACSGGIAGTVAMARSCLAASISAWMEASGSASRSLTWPATPV